MKPKRPLKPFKSAIWSEERQRWEGKISTSKLTEAVLRKLSNWLSHKKAHQCLPKKSDQQKKEDALYGKLKPIWRNNPRNHFCQALCREKGLKTPAESYPHHIRGRGTLLNDLRFWLAICPRCHHWIENNKTEARQRGWLASRDRKTMKLEGLL